MVDYRSSELGLHRIELMVNAHNARAMAAYSYRRVGFAQEGLFRSKLFQGGQFHDQMFVAVLSPLA